MVARRKLPLKMIRNYRNGVKNGGTGETLFQMIGNYRNGVKNGGTAETLFKNDRKLEKRGKEWWHGGNPFKNAILYPVSLISYHF